MRVLPLHSIDSSESVCFPYGSHIEEVSTVLPSVWAGTFSQREKLFIIMSSLAFQRSKFEKQWTGIPIVLCDSQTPLVFLYLLKKKERNKEKTHRDSPKDIQNLQIRKVEGVFINSFRQMAPYAQRWGAQTPAQCLGQHLPCLLHQCYPVQGMTLSQPPAVTQHSRERGAYTTQLGEQIDQPSDQWLFN